MKTRERLSTAVLSVLIGGLLAASCGDGEGLVVPTAPAAPGPPAPSAGTGAQYVIAGAGRPSNPFFVDDFVRVFVNGAFIGEFAGCVVGATGCNAAPVKFQAAPGGTLVIEAYDRGGSYGTDDVFLYRNGTQAKRLVEINRCEAPSLPCPTAFGAPVMYFRESFELP